MDVATLKRTFERLIKSEKFKYNTRYREKILLRNGIEAVVRLVRPEDKVLFMEGFQKLSPHSRFMRFHSSKLSLSPEELSYFTEVDGNNHVAIGVSTRNPDKSFTGMGVARFIRFKDAPELAEAAIVIRDEFQQLGLGTILLTRIMEAGRERGIKRFQFGVLQENAGMRKLLDKVCALYEIDFDGEQLVIDVAL